MLVGLVALGPGAASAQLPPVAVPTVVPELRVETPQVQVQTPRLPVPAPQVRVEVPQARVQTPAVRVPTPQQPVATPQVRVTAPRVQVQTPQARVQTPQLPTAQRPSAGTPRVSRPASGGGAAPSGSGAVAAAPGADGSGAARSGPAQASGSAPAEARSDASRPPAPGSSERPAARSRRDATARQARGPRRERRLRRTVARLAGCLDAIAPLPRQVLSLRAGAGSSDPQSRRAVAARLDTNVHRVARAERKGLRQLRRAARAGRCDGAAPDPAAAAAPSSGERGGGITPPAPVTAEREERGEARPAVAGVQGEFRSGGKPDPETLMPPAGDATEPPIMLLVLAAFAIGFAAMWARDRGWGGRHRLGPRPR